MPAISSIAAPKKMGPITGALAATLRPSCSTRIRLCSSPLRFSSLMSLAYERRWRLSRERHLNGCDWVVSGAADCTVPCAESCLSASGPVSDARSRAEEWPLSFTAQPQCRQLTLRALDDAVALMFDLPFQVPITIMSMKRHTADLRAYDQSWKPEELSG